MKILGIESSCDETGLAILDVSDPKRVAVLGEVLASQVALHELYGGVVPELASREHLRNLPLLFEELAAKTGIGLRDLDGIGVTCGPGLKGCLLIGITFAQGLQKASGLPLFPVNHIEGHILSGELHEPTLKPPYLALVVSGGHTELVLVEGLGVYTCLCRTRDDAAGEAFDKSANLLNLGYPGGAKLAQAADAAGPTKRYTLPRVAREMDDFSFSGLKTAVLMLVRKCAGELSADPTALGALSWAIQDAIVDTLVHKSRREAVARKLPLVVCGGVSANQELRRRLSAEISRAVFPPLHHCVDNGAMIAYVAGRYLKEGVGAPRLDIFSRWPVEDLRSYYGVSHEAR